MVDELICDLGREYGLKQRAAIQENIIRRLNYNDLSE